ncbi:hypothetical protein PFAG_01652 [Plasmodium falciparum Santa Lucia]|uniref:Uncharacterized protein n=1 Tax=Plasmodium falciparum Santa Lucia TaxID=478859 RepID=W7FT36_PLAFA|nr:hypothetical protein PFAG_01652 [Plasmodium falciparum Santa Lucia]
MAPDRGGTQEDPIDDKDAKHLLDSIGKIVHEKVKKDADAKKYIKELKGNLQYAKGSSETVTFLDTCKLVEEYYMHPNGGDSGKRYPCKKLSGKDAKKERFSDTLGGQCTDSKIKGNKNNCGACAPYRRLHLCDKNMETISNYNSNARHKLLGEVCMAAKYEGNSIETYYTPYLLNNEGTSSQLCTVLLL